MHSRGPLGEPRPRRVARRSRAARRSTGARARASADRPVARGARGRRCRTPRCSAGWCAGGSRGWRRRRPSTGCSASRRSWCSRKASGRSSQDSSGRIWTLRRDYPRLRDARRVPRLVAARHRPGRVRATGSQHDRRAARGARDRGARAADRRPGAGSASPRCGRWCAPSSSWSAATGSAPPSVAPSAANAATLTRATGASISG